MTTHRARRLRLADGRRRLRGHLHSAFWGFLTLSLVVTVEICVDIATSDLEDAIFAGLAALFVVTLAGVHSSRPIAWVTPLVAFGRRLYAWPARFAGCSGLNLRLDPTVRRGRFGWRPQVMATVTILVIALGLIEILVPASLRSGLGAISASLYLVVLVALWAGLIVAWFGYGILAGSLVADLRHARAENAGRLDAERPSGTWLTVAILVGSIVAALGGVSAVVPFAGLLGCVASALLILTVREAYATEIVFRSQDEAEEVGIPLPPFLLPQCLLAALIPMFLILVACGNEALGGDGGAIAMPVSTVLGRAAAWAACCGAGVMTFYFVGFVDRARRDRLERSVPKRIVAASLLSAPATAALAADGWQIFTAPEEAPRDAVPLDPKHVDASTPAAREALLRRRRVVLRRLVRRGLRRVLRRAARHEYREGAGFVIAPHLWFVPRLTRDEDESHPETRLGTFAQTLGPDWAAAISGAARQHLANVLGCLEIDLIFLEDGVGHAGLRRVLTVLYEVFDVHDGGRAVRDRDFAGLSGLCVLLHEYGPQTRFSSDVYPEPNFKDVSRARLLHVFKDRGGEEERDTVTSPRERVPMLV